MMKINLIMVALALRVSCPFANAFTLMADTFQDSSIYYGQIRRHRTSTSLFDKCRKEDTNNNDDVDWRAFRAQLVQSESTGSINTDKSTWAYDSGDYVEPGSVIISIPSSDPKADDIDALNNQCYRKSIVLVLDVDDDFIQGIMLNRPTNIRVADGMKFLRPNKESVNNNSSCGDSSTSRWKVWFGGESFGPYSDSPRVMCLHSVHTYLAISVSQVILPGIMMTSFSGAEAIVNKGDAKQSDFWLFCGICGWQTSSFYREMHQEGLWTIVSSDGGTILQELNIQRCEEGLLAADELCDVDSDSRNAGIHTWELLMNMIGRKTEIESVDSFGDLMLKEWATGALSFARDEGQIVKSTMISDLPAYSSRSSDLTRDSDDFDIAQYDPASSMTTSGSKTLRQQMNSKKSATGTVLRASSATQSPFLFSDQIYHKSLVLILFDDDECSGGVILNHVTDCSYTTTLADGEIVDFIVRYGGPVQCFGDDDNMMFPLIFLHRNKKIINAGIGNSVGNGIFQCTEEEAVSAMSMNVAKSDEFMVIQGLSIWKKQRQHSKLMGGILGDIEEGFFEPVQQIHVKRIWGTLMQQNKLSHETLDENLSLLQNAWLQSDDFADGRGNDKVCVFGSDHEVTTLADEALKRWMKAYFLDNE